MAKIHIISDLDLGFNEFTPLEDENIPDVDLVILNGNNGGLKRSMLYAETLANRYKDVQFVVNLGYTEKYFHYLPKFMNEHEESMEIRKNTNDSWPDNLHWSNQNIILQLRTGEYFDILCTFGFPKIYGYSGEWKDTFWYKNIIIDVTLDQTSSQINKPKETSNVCHGYLPIWATPESINEQHEKEEKKVKKWELTSTHYKILVTHVNPFNDTRLKDLSFSTYNIHLNNMLWISSNTKQEYVKFLGARLVTNPGRGKLPRSHVVEV